MSIKWKILGYLTVFVVVLIVGLWLFQIVFLDQFYHMIKTSELERSSTMIASNIDSSELDSLIERLIQQNGIGVRIISVDGDDLFDGEELEYFYNNIIYHLSSPELAEILSEVKQQGGAITKIYSRKDYQNNQEKMEKPPIMGSSVSDLTPQQNNKAPEEKNEKEYANFPWPYLPSLEETMPQNMIHAQLVTRSNGENVLLLVSTAMNQVNSTVETLKVQLWYVLLILLVMSVLLARVLSRRICRPIIGMNQTAKKLATGDYSVRFTGKGYLEINELNATLNYAAQELSKVEGLRRELIANISHDLRTPLTMITGYAEVMRDLPGENTPENVQIIIDEANRLSALVTDLLDLSKLQAGVQELNLTCFNLTDSVRDVMQRYAKLTGKDGYTIDYQSSGDAYVKADEQRLMQVVYNLINNAIHYTGPDKRVVVCQRVQGNKVRLEVIDSGEGISADQLPYIWERYYKVDKKHKRGQIGTGLGLSIVRSVLEMHGATYGVESSVGKGSNFWFELPIAPKEEEGNSF